MLVDMKNQPCVHLNSCQIGHLQLSAKSRFHVVKQYYMHIYN